jgi:hypothetical protein
MRLPGSARPPASDSAPTPNGSAPVAAGGGDFPYGKEFDAGRCNTEDADGEARSVAEGGKFARCRSAVGAYDMSGNVAEWTSDQTVRGGDYTSADEDAACSAGGKALGRQRAPEHRVPLLRGPPVSMEERAPAHRRPRSGRAGAAQDLARAPRVFGPRDPARGGRLAGTRDPETAHRHDRRAPRFRRSPRGTRPHQRDDPGRRLRSGLRALSRQGPPRRSFGGFSAGQTISSCGRSNSSSSSCGSRSCGG